MKTIKYRQAIYSNGGFANWHYWGFNGDGAFVKPMVGDDCGESYQNTTLRDRNGKEIYEGDICRVPNWKERDKPQTYSIITVEYVEVLGSDDMGTNMIGFPTMDEYGKPEVIGNIHENPELLK